MLRRRGLACASLAVGIGAAAPLARAVSVIDLQTSPGGESKLTATFSAGDEGAPMLQSAGLDHAIFLTPEVPVDVPASPITVSFNDPLRAVSGDIDGATAQHHWLIEARNLGGVVVSDATVGAAAADAGAPWSLADGSADIASVTFSLLPNTPETPPVTIVSSGGDPKTAPGSAPLPVPVPPMA